MAALSDKEKRLAELQAEIAKANEEIKDLRELISENNAFGGGNQHQIHIEECSIMIGALQRRRAAFADVKSLLRASADPMEASRNLRNANISVAIRYHEEWSRYDSNVSKQLNSLLTASEQFYPDYKPDTKNKIANVLPPLLSDGLDAVQPDYSALFQHTPPAHVAKLLAEEVRSLHYEVTGPLAREASSRRNAEASLEELRRSQTRLVSWCRQQRSTLEALVDHDHIHEFTNSFQANIGVMETNFMVLMELAEPLLPNSDVEKLIIEANHVWLDLQVYAFEKLNRSILTQHASSGLEEACQQWELGSSLVKDFLLTAQRLLDMPADEDSDALTEPIKAQLREVLEDWDAHEIILSHLTQFGAREDSLRDYYVAIRRTIFSRLTLMTQVHNSQYNFERKAEYMDRLAELTDWVACKSHTDSWQKLQERVDKMKIMIEDNEKQHGSMEA